ncbi:hypothetical protein GALMADRAFT_607321 [Galerina marginata CBS 339.88]|uniref:GDS1 winged helix domain-containing protein n=1 Tax=Galerina marginata (strain CBS 339.88) TaxID=685588 RepID=A0A067SR42_GALM3|nr:hypothetical protein GALMADRAFT_607321 [Galerina marginata CBS 339.88]
MDSYHTRIRHKPDSTPCPPFPPPNVVLHPDDATNKVFLAVARAFVSVDNRAMTIKDIADLASRYGLVCQNLSAAAQAVTTYLRSHKTRCDKQQDQPLLLSHTLSGTPADDHLVPALYSRSGGDSHPLPDRLTNFRKGTAVWYLSRATGLPCPFARAGIRLCDYITTDADPSLEGERRGKRERRRLEYDDDQICGQKRKRPLRGCATRADASENERPPKVKLTLRLKPLIRSTNPEPTPEPAHDDDSDPYDSDESMSSDDQSHTAQIDNESEEPWSLPPYPRRSISIPCYTPSVESFYPTFPPPETYKDQFRRSPSVPFATPPPDSEDESDDFHITMAKNYPDADEDGWDADLDSEGEGDTVWESPGPRSPSAPLVQPTQVAVKQEPRDVQGMLDAWEDFDSTVADARVAEVLTKALEVKTEPLDPWDWDAHHSEWPAEETARIKQEDFGVDSLFPQNVPGPSSPLSSLPAFSDTSSPPQPGTEPEADDDRSHRNYSYATVRPRAKTVPAPSPFFQTPSTSFSLPPPLTRPSVSNSKSTSREPSVPSTALVRLLQSMSVNTSSTSSIALPPPTPCVSPLQTRCQPASSFTLAPVVVTTCQPCKPAISATQIEDISVYQMMLGAFQLLRRIDTDFVNLSPIIAFSGAAAPNTSASTIANATHVTKGSPEVCGTWVPLAAAQAYVKEHLPGDRAAALEVFLSDRIVERFPTALQDFHRSGVCRGLNQFGRHFASTLQAAKWEVQTTEGGVQFQPQPVSPVLPQFALGLHMHLGGEKQADDNEVPLSATEQQLFHELCVIPDEVVDADGDVSMDMETDPVPPPRPPPLDLSLSTEKRQQDISQEPMSPLSPLPPSPQLGAAIMTPLVLSPLSPTFGHQQGLPPQAPAERSDRPLRRSKRVADALAVAASHPTPSRARSRKNGSRNSLS